MEIIEEWKKNEKVMTISSSIDKYYVYIPFVLLQSKHPEPASWSQREKMSERVEKFTNILDNYYDEFGKIHDLNTIHIGIYQHKLYIIDGQHRFKAYENFFESNPEGKETFRVMVCIYLCETIDDIFHISRDLNDIVISEYMNLDIDDAQKKHRIKEYIKQHYKHYISESESPMKPNVNAGKMTDMLMELFPTSSSAYICDKLEEINQKLGEELRKSDPENIRTKILLKVKDVKDAKPLYYSYEYHRQKTLENAGKRKKFSKIDRKTIYVQYFGSWKEDGQCQICKSTIDYENFDMGHIKSVKNGGSNLLENIKPLCKTCNTSLGSLNIDDYMKKHNLS